MNNDVSVLAFMICRAEDEKRLEMFSRTVEEAIATAGMEFDLVLVPMSDAAVVVAKDLSGEYPKVTVWEPGGNVGQHVVMNEMIKMADDEGYDKLLRLDDDIKFSTKRWLYKMCEAQERLGDNFIVSPTVVGLMYPPESTPVVEQDGIKFRVLLSAIGGICRLHSVEALCDPINPYVSDVRSPMGFGDATGIAKWCMDSLQEHGIHLWMVYLETVRVKHAKGTVKQVEDQKDYHEKHDMFQKLPYIPVWEGKWDAT